jgi:hypothetical protein
MCMEFTLQFDGELIASKHVPQRCFHYVVP